VSWTDSLLADQAMVSLRHGRLAGMREKEAGVLAAAYGG